jgi:hypothetical protein
MQLATVPDEQSVYIDENNIELGSTYYYRVKAINSVNESQYSPVAKVAPALQVTPATNIGAFSFTANWTSVDHSEGYKVEVSQDNFQTVLSETLSQETSVQVNGLNPLTNYQFRASYSDDGFYRVSDNVMTLQTLPIVLGNVSNLQATRTEPTVQLSWDDNTEYADEFVIERSENTNDSFESIATVPVGQVGFTDESILVLGNKYYYRLKAINSVSQSSYSNEVGVSQILKLDTPQAIDTMAFTATWNTVFDAETYKIEISQDDFNSILFENQTPNTSLRIEGLQPQLEYQYRVSFLQDGNYTLSLNTETAFTLPLSPVITSIHALSRYQIQLNWTNRFPEATTIQIFRSSASNGPYSQIKSLSASFTSYLDETLSGSQTYHYKLLASNNAISTLQSKSKSATTDPLLEQTITFSSIPNLTYSSEGVTKTLSASSTSGLPIEFISSNKKVATIEGNTLTATGVGEAIITAIQSGDSDYAEASAEQTLTVNQASQTITFNPPANFTFLENGDLGLQATASSGLAVVFESSNADIVSIINNKGIVKGAGTILITAIQAGDKNYKPASSQKQVIIDKANQTITFDPITSKTYGSGNFELIAISSSGLPVAFKSLNESVAIISDNKVSILSAGKVDIVASQPGNDNFNAAPNAYQTLTIEKAPQTISFNPIPNKTYGTPDFELQVSSTSGLPVIVISKNESIAILKDNKVSIQAIGEVELIATQSGNGNYYPAPSVSQIMLVSKAVQTITFDDLPAMKFGDPDFQVQAISSSGLPVFIKSLDESKLIVTGSTAKIVGAGKVSLLATQEGNGNYSPAEVRREETIDKADQTITFPTLSFIAIGDKSFDLIATSSSGLPVEFFSSDPNKISIKDNTATIGEVGSVTITASQAGNQNFNPASPVSQTFCVNPKKPIITVDENNGAVLLRSSNNTGNQWYLNGIAIDNARSNTLVVFEPGIYTVKTTAGQCSSEFSAEMPMVITGDFIDRPSEFRVHPNPSSSVFYVKQVSCIRNLEVTNSIGALLSGAIVTQEGEHWIIDLSGYPSGVYLLTSNGCPDVLRARLLKVN